MPGDLWYKPPLRALDDRNIGGDHGIQADKQEFKFCWFSGFILAATLTPASIHDTNYLPYLTIASCHTKDPIEKVYADKGYFGQPNRAFLHLNGIKDGIMRKDTTTAKLTEIEIKRNKKISKKRYIVEQYFGLSHLHDGAYRARFTTIVKNTWDTMCRQMAFNINRGAKLVTTWKQGGRVPGGRKRAYRVSLGHWVEVEIGYVGRN